MAARTGVEAVAAFFAVHQRIVACVTQAVLSGQNYRPSLTPALMRFAEDRSIRLGRRGTISMAVREWYVVAAQSSGAGLWVVRTTGYDFRLLDREDRDIVAYHWHPSGPSRVTRPHLHIGGRTSPTDLSKVHLMTGRVGLVDIFRMAITDLGVEPQRLDWEDVLDGAERQLAP